MCEATIPAAQELCQSRYILRVFVKERRGLEDPPLITSFFPDVRVCGQHARTYENSHDLLERSSWVKREFFFFRRHC